MPDQRDDERQREAERKTYARELWRKCSSTGNAGSTSTASSSDDKENAKPGGPSAAPLSSVAARWTAFERYADEKERELWRVFVDMDRDGDMRLRKDEVREACKRAGVDVKDDATIEEFIRNVDRNGDGAISFEDWRNFFLVSSKPVKLEVFLVT